MSLTCPNCGTNLALALAVATPNPARPSGSEPLSTPVDNFAPVAPPLAHIGLEVVGSKAQTKTKAQRRKNAYSADFEAFWAVFPIHRDKDKAQPAFEAALASGANLDTIIAGAATYAQWLKTTTTAPKYAQGWLNGRRWEDELDVPIGVGELDPACIVGTEEYKARQEADWKRAEQA